ncbi:uncharacterized protein LOC144364521 [Saccoglossus kowalevskii]
MGKSRVTPLKHVSKRCLELLAATVAVRMGKLIEKKLDEKHGCVVLPASKPYQWGYVNTSHNPADDGSKRQSIQMFFKSNIWITRPEFLWQTQSQFPLRSCDSQLRDGEP